MSNESQPETIFMPGAEKYRLQQPRLVSIAYTAIYDTGAVMVGAVTHDGSDKPLEVEFRNARGSSTPLA